MRKMKMPEMDVVRFNESDVIVASGDPKTFALINMGNGIAGDSRIIYMGDEYTDSYQDTQALTALLNEAVPGSCNTFYGPADKLSYSFFQTVMHSEEDTTVDSHYGDRNGTYEYSRSDFYWVKKQ